MSPFAGAIPTVVAIGRSINAVVFLYSTSPSASTPSTYTSTIGYGELCMIWTLAVSSKTFSTTGNLVLCPSGVTRCIANTESVSVGDIKPEP